VLDELVFGAREAAWPLIRDDLSLSYTAIGLVLAVPSLVALVVEAVLGLVAFGRRRHRLVVAGGACFACGLAVAAAAPSWSILLLGFTLLYPASGAFVSLSQASLMDLQPAWRERNMARWVVAGGMGAVAGPLLVAGASLVGVGWRGLLAGFAFVTVLLVLVVRRSLDGNGEQNRPRLRDALRALAQREVARWLLLVELADLMLDVLLTFLALYLVDDVGASVTTGGLAVAIWTGCGLLGSAAMLPLLRRVDGLRYLRASAILAAALFAAFLLVPGIGPKLVLLAALALVNAGWYPVLQARLYDALGDSSSLVLTVGGIFPLNAVLPLAIAALAGRYGLGIALWPLLAAPAALLALVPRRSARISRRSSSE
jgi:FSR family fosmidomycin resistance protein-like MFS transporter